MDEVPIGLVMVAVAIGTVVSIGFILKRVDFHYAVQYIRSLGTCDDAILRRVSEALKRCYPRYGEHLAVDSCLKLAYGGHEIFLVDWLFWDYLPYKGGLTYSPVKARSLIALNRETAIFMRQRKDICVPTTGNENEFVFALKSMTRLANELRRERLKQQ